MDKTSTLILMLAVNSVLISAAKTDTDSSPSGYRMSVCNSNLNWAPMYSTKPFLVLLNGAFCPTWSTKNMISKEYLTTHINLPYGLPFSFVCGTCFKGYRKANKTLIMKHEANGYASSRYFVNQVELKPRDGREIFMANLRYCKMQYGITKSIETDGNLICQAQLGKYSAEEKVTYSVVRPEFVKNNETVEVEEDTVSLVCPEHPNLNNLLTHVWYLPNGPEGKMAASTNNPIVTFRVFAARPLVVACATFHLLDETVVMETTYTVRKISTGSYRSRNPLPARSNQLDSGELGGPGKAVDSYQIYGEEQMTSEIAEAGSSLNTVIIILLSATGVVLLLIALLSIPKWISSRRTQQNPL